MGRKYRKRRQREMREKQFHVILYHNNRAMREFALPSFFRRLPKLAALYGLIILLYFVIQFGMANYSTYRSLDVAYQNERLQVETARIMHEKVVDLRGEIQSM